jgi:thiamine-phosphate pyrophosphorylase
MKRDLSQALRLYLVTDRSLSMGRSEEEVVRAAAAGGITAVQLRGKDMTSRELWKAGVTLRRLASREGLLFIVNDRLDVAMAVGADGVHLGQEDLPVAEARRLAPHLIIGATAGNEDEAREAEVAGADYLGTVAVFPTATKTYPEPPLGLGGLGRLCRATRLPVAAMGGVKAENARAVLDAGATGIAVVSAIVSAPDPSEAARRLKMEVEGVSRE